MYLSNSPFVAPDDDDTYMDSPQTKNNKGLKQSLTQEDSVEYDNVELVLDESTLNPTSFDQDKKGKRPPTPTSGLKKFMGGSSSSRNKSTSTNKDSGGGGILKKLKKSTTKYQHLITFTFMYYIYPSNVHECTSTYR